MNEPGLPPGLPRLPFILVDILDIHLFAGHALRQGSSHESIEVAIQHIGWRSRCHPGPQILHKLIGLKHVRADLVAPADVGLGGIGGVRLRLALLELRLIKSGLELLECLGTVLVLRALILTGNDDSGRNMRNAHRTVRRVDMLSPRTGRTIGVDAQFGLVDLDVDIIVDLRIDPHRSKARVTPC